MPNKNTTGGGVIQNEVKDLNNQEEDFCMTNPNDKGLQKDYDYGLGDLQREAEMMRLDKETYMK